MDEASDVPTFVGRQEVRSRTSGSSWQMKVTVSMEISPAPIKARMKRGKNTNTHPSKAFRIFAMGFWGERSMSRGGAALWVL